MAAVPESCFNLGTYIPKISTSVNFTKKCTFNAVVIKSVFTGDKYSLSGTEDWRNLREANENIWL